MPSWIYSSSNEKSAISKLQMKNTNWSFQILMIFHEFSLLNSLWSRRHFILFSKFETKVEIWNFFQEFPKSWIFGKKFPDRSTARIPKKQIVVLMIRWFGLTDNIRFDLRIRLISWDSCETKFMNFLYQVVYAIFKYFFLDYSWKIRQRLFSYPVGIERLEDIYIISKTINYPFFIKNTHFLINFYWKF